MMQISPMTESDRTAVHRLLRATGLPVDGFDSPHIVGVVARDAAGSLIGSAAIEVYGHDGLLRSVAVAESARGRGVGHQLTRAALQLARDRGLSALYLLTETAGDFFPKFGFVAVARSHIPAEVKSSVEFTTACPASAQAFHLSFKGVSNER